MLTQATQGSDAMMGSEIGMLSQEMMARMHTDDRTSVAAAVMVDKLGHRPEYRRHGHQDSHPARRIRAAAVHRRSLASLVVGEITIAADAAPGERELRIVGAAGASNPLVFFVGQLPEASRAADAHQRAAGSGQRGARPAQAAGKRRRAAHYRALHRERPNRVRRGAPLPLQSPARVSGW